MSQSLTTKAAIPGRHVEFVVEDGDTTRSVANVVWKAGRLFFSSRAGKPILGVQNEDGFTSTAREERKHTRRKVCTYAMTTSSL